LAVLPTGGLPDRAVPRHWPGGVQAVGAPATQAPLSHLVTCAARPGAAENARRVRRPPFGIGVTALSDRHRHVEQSVAPPTGGQPRKDDDGAGPVRWDRRA